jgi:DNA-binding response OmpR family regulator
MAAPKLLIASNQKALKPLSRPDGLLADLGFKIIRARSASEAISKFIKERAEVAIIDYELPRSGGVKVASEILLMSPSTKIIMSIRKHDVIDPETEAIGIDVFLPRTRQKKRMLESIFALYGLKRSLAIIAR